MAGAKPHNMEYDKDVATGELTYRMTIALRHQVSQKEIFDAVTSLEGVRKVNLRRG